MPTLRRLVKIATKFRYVCSRNYGFVVFFFFGSEQKGGVRVASVLQRLVMRPPRDERNKKRIYATGSGGARIITLQAWGLALLTSLDAAALLTGLTLLGRDVL